MIPTPPANIETTAWNSGSTNPAVFTIYSSTKTPVPTNQIREERIIYRKARNDDSQAIKRAGYRWARIIKTYPDPGVGTQTTQPPTSSPPPPNTLSPVEPAEIRNGEWNSGSTSSLFTIHRVTRTPVPPDKIREERIIYRRALPDDPQSIKRVGYRWARIARTYPDPNYVPPAPPRPPPPPSTPAIDGNQLAADLTAAAASGPLFNQGIAEAITNLVPAEYQQVVGVITQSVLDALPGPNGATNTPPPPPPPPPPPAAGPSVTLDPTVRNALLLAAGVGAIYFFFIRK